MKQLITFDADCGILGELELTASADVTRDGADIVAENTKVSALIPGGEDSTTRHLSVTHLIDEADLDNITEKIMEASVVKLEEPKKDERGMYF